MEHGAYSGRYNDPHFEEDCNGMIFAKIGEIGARGVSLVLPGETRPTEKFYNYLDSYSPVVGDRVAVIKTGGTFLVIGKLKY